MERGQLADPKTSAAQRRQWQRPPVIAEPCPLLRKLASHYLEASAESLLGHIPVTCRGSRRMYPQVAVVAVGAGFRGQRRRRLRTAYIISPEKRSTVSEPRGLLKDVDVSCIWSRMGPRVA